MDFNDERNLETYRSLISISVQGLKTLLLVNGGAVVALLTFLGHSPLDSSVAQDFSEPIRWFIFGLAACVLAFMFAYWTQYAFFNNGRKDYNGPNYKCLQYGTALLAVLSFIFFTLGSFSSIDVFGNDQRIGNSQHLKAQAVDSTLKEVKLSCTEVENRVAKMSASAPKSPAQPEIK